MAASRTNTVPLWLKLVYTAFMAVLVPVYWVEYGPTNFLYFCDVALFMALAALWLENRWLASTPAVGILVPQTLWIVDFLAALVGVPLIGLTTYMFDDNIPLFARGLSSFHFWLPLLLVWLVWRLGYDRRAFWSWTILAWIILPICFYLMPAPPAPEDNKNLPVNINYVHGLETKKKQDFMDPHLYFVAMFLGLPIVSFLPSHLVLSWIGKPRPVTS